MAGILNVHVIVLVVYAHIITCVVLSRLRVLLVAYDLNEIVQFNKSLLFPESALILPDQIQYGMY